MKKSIQALLFMFPIIQLSACVTTPKTEADHYTAMRTGTIYKTYQKVSINAMKPVIKEYDKKLAKENKAMVGSAHVHALLGLIWIATLEPKYALAETELAVTQAQDPRDRYAALILQSVVMHQLGWPYLAKQNSEMANALVKAQGLSNRYNNILVLVHVAGSALALQEGNISYVANEVRELGTVTNQPWVIELGDVTQEAYSGTRAEAIVRLEKLKNNPKLSDKERQGVTEVMAAATNSGNDVGVAVAKAVVSVGFYVGIQNNLITPSVLEKLPEKYRSKLVKYLN